MPVRAVQRSAAVTSFSVLGSRNELRIGPFTSLGPLRNTPEAATVGLLCGCAIVGLVPWPKFRPRTRGLFQPGINLRSLRRPTQSGGKCADVRSFRLPVPLPRIAGRFFVVNFCESCGALCVRIVVDMIIYHQLSLVSCVFVIVFSITVIHTIITLMNHVQSSSIIIKDHP